MGPLFCWNCKLTTTGRANCKLTTTGRANCKLTTTGRGLSEAQFIAAGCSPEKFVRTLELNSGRNAMIKEIMRKLARSQQPARRQPLAGSHRLQLAQPRSR